MFSKAIYGDAEAKKQTMALINDYLATKPENIAGVVPYVLMRINEVGRGLEGKLTDLVSGRIIRADIAPQFKAGNFDGGIAAGHARRADQ